MKTTWTDSFAEADAWRRLLVSSAASPTLGPAFAAARWEQRSDRAASLRVLRLEQDGVLVGVLPLAARELRRAGMRYRELVTLSSLAPEGSALALGDDGLLVLPGHEQAAIAGLQRALAEPSLGGWDGLTIAGLPGDAVSGALLRASLGGLGPCVLHVSAGERYARLGEDVVGGADEAHVVPFSEGDELLSMLVRRAGLSHLRDACDALAVDGAVELAWRGERSTATAMCVAVMRRATGVSVLASWAVDDVEHAALHRARMRSAADAGLTEYAFWHAPPNVARLGHHQRPVRTLALERRGRGAQVRGVATMASELWRFLAVREG